MKIIRVLMVPKPSLCYPLCVRPHRQHESDLVNDFFGQVRYQGATVPHLAPCFAPVGNLFTKNRWGDGGFRSPSLTPEQEGVQYGL